MIQTWENKNKNSKKCTRAGSSPDRAVAVLLAMNPLLTTGYAEDRAGQACKSVQAEHPNRGRLATPTHHDYHSPGHRGFRLIRTIARVKHEIGPSVSGRYKPLAISISGIKFRAFEKNSVALKRLTGTQHLEMPFETGSWMKRVQQSTEKSKKQPSLCKEGTWKRGSAGLIAGENAPFSGRYQKWKKVTMSFASAHSDNALKLTANGKQEPRDFQRGIQNAI